MNVAAWHLPALTNICHPITPQTYEAAQEKMNPIMEVWPPITWHAAVNPVPGKAMVTALLIKCPDDPCEFMMKADTPAGFGASL